MNPKSTKITNKDLIIKTKNIGIKDSSKLSTEKLLDTLNRYKNKKCVIKCS